MYAATDASRGVWKAPAGTNAGLTGVTGLEVVLTDKQNGILNPQGVNCVRRMPAGYLIWGARTVAGFDNSGNTDFTYVPVRRMTLFLEESLYRGTQWAVFEPNDEPLWSQIRMNLNAFMMGLFTQGAFQGSTPAQAFFVKCDTETTSQADIDQGIVNIIVGFAPLEPAEFVIVTIQQIVGNLG
jgi:phage tail sheath protein FI